MIKPINFTLAQINPIVGDIPYNVSLITRVAEQYHNGTDLIIFPEMTLSGYPPEDLVLKPFFLDLIEQALSNIIELSKNISAALLIGLPQRINGETYNSAVLIENGSIIGQTHKTHLPNYGVFDEQRIFKSSDLPVPIEFKGLKLGVMICEDMWEEDVASNLHKNGADILISMNASPFEQDKSHQRQNIAKDRIKETSLPLIYVNQCGGQDELVFDGTSFIMNEKGQVVYKAEEFVESIHHTSWEKTSNHHWISSTSAISQSKSKEELVYQAVMIGLRDYVTKNGFPGVIIGLSGGIDSALTAAIAVDALGKDSVQCVMMPYKYTSAESLSDAQNCAQALGVHLDEISIERIVKTFEHELEPHFNNNTPQVTHENIQSRCRGLLLMALSNATGKMVLSTGNKSEMAVGYATIYGDMCGGFNVLKDLYKTQVYDLSKWRNTNIPGHSLCSNKLVIPENIINKEPTAELRPNQTDQDSLPPYSELDDILHCLIEKDFSVNDIVERGHKEDTVKKIWRLLDIAEYKRRQAPPGVKITSRSFGRDRRYPITNHLAKIIDKIAA